VPPVAPYPDPLLAQVLAAATYASQIPEAARWADAHSYLSDVASLASVTEHDGILYASVTVVPILARTPSLRKS
jgi:Protein of unknown function (DUF3300)